MTTSTRLGRLRSLSKNKQDFAIDLSALQKVTPFGASQLAVFCEGAARSGHHLSIYLPEQGKTESELARLRTLRNTSAGIAEEAKIDNRRRARLFLDAYGFTHAFSCPHLAVDFQPVLRSGDPRGVDHVEDLDLGSVTRRPVGKITAEAELLPDSSRTPHAAEPSKWQTIDALPVRWLRLGSEEDVRQSTEQIWEELQAHDVAGYVKSIVEELAGNIFEHSDAGASEQDRPGDPYGLIGVFFERTVAPPTAHDSTANSERLIIVAVDSGTGIPDSLRSAYSRHHGTPRSEATDHQVIEWAFTDSASSKENGPRNGSGLGLVRRLTSNRYGAGIHVVSNGGQAWTTQSGWDIPNDSNARPMVGTSLRLATPRNRPEVAQTSAASDTDNSRPSIAIGTLDSRSGEVSWADDNHEQADFSVVCATRESRQRFVDTILDLASRIPNLGLLLPPDDADGALATLEPARAQLAEVANTVFLIAPSGYEFIVDEANLTEGQRKQLEKSVNQACIRATSSLILDEINKSSLKPQLTWSMGVVNRWVDGGALTGNPAERLLTSYAVACLFSAPPLTAEHSELIVTEPQLTQLGDLVAGWLGIQRDSVTTLGSAYEPDFARFRRPEARSSLILTTIVNQGAAIGPTVRGLRKAGQSVDQCIALVDGRAIADRPVEVNGDNVPVNSLAALDFSADPTDSDQVKSDALRATQDRLETLRAGKFANAVAASNGTVQLGHFHTDRLTWSSCALDHRKTISSTTKVGEVILEDLVDQVVSIMDADRPIQIHPVSAGGLPARRLASGLHAALTSLGLTIVDPTTVGLVHGNQHLVLDWGALTWSSLLQRGRELAALQADQVLLAVAVDRFGFSRNNDLEGSLVLGTAPTTIRRARSYWLPLDPKVAIGCPLCAIQRDIEGLARQVSPERAAERLVAFKVLGAFDQAQLQPSDAYGDRLTPTDERDYLSLRELLFECMDDKLLAYGLTLELEGQTNLLTASERDALCRVFIHSPELIKRRPFTSPTFRDSLSRFAQANLLRGRISQGQWLTLIRVASKSKFLTTVRSEFENLDETAQSDALMDLASLLAREYHQNDTMGRRTRDTIRVLAQTSTSSRTRRELSVVQNLAITSSSQDLASSWDSPHAVWDAVQHKLVQLVSHVEISQARNSLLSLFADLDLVLRDQNISTQDQTDWNTVSKFVIEELAPTIRAAQSQDSTFRGPEFLAEADVKRIFEIDSFFRTVERTRTGAEVAELSAKGQRLLALITPRESATIDWAMSVPASIADSIHWVDSRGQVPITTGQLPTQDTVLVSGDILRTILAQVAQNTHKHQNEASPRLHLSFKVDDERVQITAESFGTISSDEQAFAHGGMSLRQFGGQLRLFGGQIRRIQPPTGGTFAVEIELLAFSRDPIVQKLHRN